MKITYTHPLDLTKTPIEVDLDNDFIKVNVETANITESNKFLVSLWHQFNINLSPLHSQNRVPWAYFPGRFLGKKSHVVVLGFIQTSIGDIYIALSYRTKGCIDAIHYHKPSRKFKSSDIEQLKELTANALKKKEDTKKFLCQANLEPHVSGLIIETYIGRSFHLSPTKDGKLLFIQFYVDGVDSFEAEQSAMEKLYDICAFLSIEMNIRITFDEFKVADDVVLSTDKRKSAFINDYIDYYPIIDRWKLCLSQYAIDFIDSYVLNTPRFQKKPSDVRYFLSACKHIQLGMVSEENLNEKAVCALPTMTFSLSNINTKSKMENSTSAMMSYLSALECSSASDTTGETCKECGAVKYKISARVKNIASKYLGEDLGRVFQKLYDYRSKFLHAGKFPSDSNFVRTMPLLSEDSATGLLDLLGFSINIDGNVMSYTIQNIREWSTYILRCHYQEQFCGRHDFKDVLTSDNQIMLPLQIQAVSPEGAIQMNKMFVRTDTDSYKTKIHIKKCIYLLKKWYSDLIR